MTRQLQQLYFQAVLGELPGYERWVMPAWR